MLRAVRGDYPQFTVNVRQIRKNSSQEHYHNNALHYEFNVIAVSPITLPCLCLLSPK